MNEQISYLARIEKKEDVDFAIAKVKKLANGRKITWTALPGGDRPGDCLPLNGYIGGVMGDRFVPENRVGNMLSEDDVRTIMAKQFV